MSSAYLRQELVYVAASPVHGRGLFARVDIPAETELGICATQPAAGAGPHVLWLDEATRPVQVTCDLRYINHAAQPNVAYYEDLSVMTLRDIQAGEELLHHYGDDWA